MEYKITNNLTEEDYLNFNKEYVLKFKRLKTILLANLSSALPIGHLYSCGGFNT